MKILKRLLIGLFILGFLGLGAAYAYLHQTNPRIARHFYLANGWLETKEKVLLRVENHDYSQFEMPKQIVHRTLRFNHSREWNVPDDLLDGIEDSGALFLSLECWGSQYWPVKRSRPLQGIINGMYDAKIKGLVKVLRESKVPVYLRFNQHMEVPSRYLPWQEYPSIYISAYRHIYDLIKEQAPEVQMVWGPAGYPGLEESYPGEDYVDAMSINLISPSEEFLSVYPKQDLSTELRRRMHRLRFFDHPCFVLGSLDQLPSAEQLEELAAYQKANPYLFPLLGESEAMQKPATDSSFHIGIYDPDEKLLDAEIINAEHIFINLATFVEEGFLEKFVELKRGKRNLILTVETISDHHEERDDDCLNRLLAGVYDKDLDHLLDSLKTFPRALYLRFSQEMEIPIFRYPWQSKEPQLYIDAYRYLMNRAREELDSVYLVWGPAGDRGSIEWYPGDDVVDYVSFAVYGLPDKNITDPNLQESFADIYKRKAWRMRQLDKPIFITEFGVKGPEEFQKQWLLKAAETIREAPELSGICYFNMHDVPQAWGDIAPPDWSVEPETYHAFIEAIGR